MHTDIKMQAMVFAAGLGTRLKPLTDTMPKAMVSVGGQPLIRRVLQSLSQAGAGRVVVNVHHFASQITGYLAAKGLAFELFARLLSFHEENVHKLRPPAVEYVEKAIRYVKDNFGDDIGVSDMAAAVGVGRSYLCILFKKLTSVSPVEYLISYRIGQAEKMLASGLSVTETALSCGFNSPAHFCVQFKKRTGRTPSRYPEKDL